MNEGAVRESVAGGLHGAGADITVSVMLRIAKGCGECPDVLAMTGAISHTHSTHIDIIYIERDGLLMGIDRKHSGYSLDIL